MRTPVSAARECLTDESALALDDAVTVARRRSHRQTTSLHAISALLALPSSTLRDACARAGSSVYSPRLQFRALELCVGVSLDRLPTSKSVDEPPISNSLMAAIKRSQANQRRHPETFRLYQQQLQNQTSSFSSSLSCVKVELKHFILSILDDPIVSRVFGDAGFRSSDIKLAILHPPTISRFPISRSPPVFLCNLPQPDPNLKFPFGVLSGDEDNRRIGEILVKKMGRNPLLIGVSARDSVARFLETIQSGKNVILPEGINGKIGLISIEKEIHEFLAGKWSEKMMGLRFKEIREAVEGCTEGGIVVNYGELKVFVEGASSCDAVEYLISQLGNLVKVYGEKKLWLIGAVESYETYMKFSTRFPLIEKEWDISLLPITSSNSKTSLMGSFVPFGGFFPSSHEIANLSSRTNLSVIRCCDLCNEKYKQEVNTILKGGSSVSIANQESASLTSWLTPEADTSKRMNAIEAKDHGSVLNVRLVEVQKKWNDICQRLHHSQSFQQDISQVRSYVPDIDSLPNKNRLMNLEPSNSGNFQKILVPRQNPQLAISSEAEDISPSQQNLPVDFFANMYTSSSSTASVTTDLGLATIYAWTEKGQDHGKVKVKLQTQEDRLQNIPGSVSAELDGIRKSPPKQMASSSQRSDPVLEGHSGKKDFKQLCGALVERVDWQHEAIYSISHTISRCRSGNEKRRGPSRRGDIWLNFLGPDKIGKRKIASALAETIFGSKDSLIIVDLTSEIGFGKSNSIFESQHPNLYDVKARGKTEVDYIAEELSRKPHSVVLLENVDKADFLSQNRLSSAIRTGKFQNTYGREISINGMIFVTTSSSNEVEEKSFSKNALYSEETVLEAKGLQMQIAVESVPMNVTFTNTSNSNILLIPKKTTSNPASINKRKIIETDEFEISMPAIKVSRSCIDLNLPVEEMDGGDDCGTSDNNDSSSEPKEVWLEDFLDQVDDKVVFKPFEFDALAENILKEIGRSFQKIVGKDVVLEIGKEVLVQILASSWLSENKRSMEEWFETVLYRGFMEAKQKHCISSRSVVKLLPVEGDVMEEQAPHVCLPRGIIIN